MFFSSSLHFALKASSTPPILPRCSLSQFLCYEISIVDFWIFKYDQYLIVLGKKQKGEVKMLLLNDKQKVLAFTTIMIANVSIYLEKYIHKLCVMAKINLKYSSVLLQNFLVILCQMFSLKITVEIIYFALF